MGKRVILTGIKPTGKVHIGNYLGAIRPALERAPNYEARYFIADYHSLNTMKDPEALRSLSYEVAASWIACGLNPDEVLIYRQSDVPETFELCTMLTSFTAKGLMNRAHAYKARIDKNRQEGQPDDHGVNMGLYTYPILMAADILLFDTHFVPVGRDQVQHIEMAADIAQGINHNYQKELFTLPKVLLSEDSQVVNGLDGRKMSKSYGNTIPLFLEEKQLKRVCNKIITNSQGVDEPKDPDSCSIFSLYRLFASPEEQHLLRKRYRAGGMGWGEAKAELFRVMNAHLSPLREVYNTLIQDRPRLDRILLEGARKARSLASSKIHFLRREVGFY